MFLPQVSLSIVLKSCHLLSCLIMKKLKSSKSYQSHLGDISHQEGICGFLAKFKVLSRCHDFLPVWFNLSLKKFFFIFSFIFISWRLITLQYCSGFCHWHELAMDLYVFPIPILPPPSLPLVIPVTSPEHLSHASNLGLWSVSPLIIYTFQCYSLRSSYPRLLPESPKVCSMHLCPFFCPAYRVIVTIF